MTRQLKKKLVIHTYRFFNEGDEAIPFGFQRLWIPNYSAVPAKQNKIKMSGSASPEVEEVNSLTLHNSF